MDARPGHTYRIHHEGEEVEHFNVVRVHGRRIYFAVTAYSALRWQTTRLRWRKMIDLLQKAGATVTEEPTPALHPYQEGRSE